LTTGNLDGVNVWAGKVIQGTFAKTIKNQGFWLYTWTVNDVNQAKELLSYGVDAITTDRAAWLTQKLTCSIE